MKPDNIKKLQLNKQTVSRLNSFEMKETKGGKVIISGITTALITIAEPYTCLCSYNTQPWSCCGGCDTPECG